MNSLTGPLALSLKIALLATSLVVAIGIPLAWLLGRKRFWGRSIVETLITMPLVLPPTVVGYLIIITFGAQGFPGKWLKSAFDYSILFRLEGAVLAAATVALPMLYLPAKAAFANVEREMEDIARLAGASRLQIFWHVSLPFARRGIASGVILAFARALGEFGATVMVFGWRTNGYTLPISVYNSYEQDDISGAAPAVLALLCISFGLIVAYNASSAGRRDSGS